MWRFLRHKIKFGSALSAMLFCIFCAIPVHALTVDDLTAELSKLATDTQTLQTDIQNAKNDPLTTTAQLDALTAQITAIGARTSAIKGLLVTAPSAPAVRATTSSDCGANITLSYTPPASGTVLKYELNRNPDGNQIAQWGVIGQTGTLPIDTKNLPPEDNGLRPDTLYQYQLRAVGPGDVEAYSAIVSAKSSAVCPPPPATVSVVARLGGGSISAGSSVTISGTGFSPTGNTVTIKNASTGAVVATLNAPSQIDNALTFTIPNTVAAGSYVVTVNNGNGNSQNSPAFAVSAPPAQNPGGVQGSGNSAITVQTNGPTGPDFGVTQVRVGAGASGQIMTPADATRAVQQTVTPPVCSYTYSSFGACQPNGTQARTVTASTPAGCTGTPQLSQSCTYTPPACTYNFTNWGDCQPNSTQTRTVTASTPTGCVGTPVLSQACTYTPPVCTYTYSNFSPCQPNSTQTRTVTASAPTGCVGTPALTQVCTYVPPPCTYTYSAWGYCQNNQQARTVTSNTPAGCSGTPVISQSCTSASVPPVSVGAVSGSLGTSGSTVTISGIGFNPTAANNTVTLRNTTTGAAIVVPVKSVSADGKTITIEAPPASSVAGSYAVEVKNGSVVSQPSAPVTVASAANTSLVALGGTGGTGGTGGIGGTGGTGGVGGTGGTGGTGGSGGITGAGPGFDSGLVPCGTESSGGVVTNPCGWNHFITLLTNIVNYLIILGAAVSALAFAYAGFLMLTAGGEMNKIEEAKSIFGKVVIGFVIMLSAWLVVHAIEAAFISPDSGINSLLGS